MNVDKYVLHPIPIISRYKYLNPISLSHLENCILCSILKKRKSFIRFRILLWSQKYVLYEISNEPFELSQTVWQR